MNKVPAFATRDELRAALRSKLEGRRALNAAVAMYGRRRALRITQVTIESEDGCHRTTLAAVPEDAPHSVEVRYCYLTERARLRPLGVPVVHPLAASERSGVAATIARTIVAREPTAAEHAHLFALLDLIAGV